MSKFISASKRIENFLEHFPNYTIQALFGGTELSCSVYQDGTTIMFCCNGSYFDVHHSRFESLFEILEKDINNWEAKNAIAELNQIAEKAMEVNSTSVCIKPCKSKSLADQPESNKVAELEKAIAQLKIDDDSQLDLIKTVVNELERLTRLYGTHDRAIAKLNSKIECYDKALDFDNKAIADLNLKIEALQSGLDKIKIAFDHPDFAAIAPESKDVTSSTFVIHLTHCDRRYEAFWRENNSSFSIFEVNRHGYLAFVGGVTVEKEQSWTNEIFLSIAKSIISSYLDGKESSLSPF